MCLSRIMPAYWTPVDEENMRQHLKICLRHHDKNSLACVSAPWREVACATDLGKIQHAFQYAFCKNRTPRSEFPNNILVTHFSFINTSHSESDLACA